MGLKFWRFEGKLAFPGLVGEPDRRGTSLEPPVLIYNVQSIYEFSDILSR